MTQTPKVLIALAIVAVSGVAANYIARPAVGIGDQCRRAAGDAQRHCYSALLSERLADYGVADAMQTLEQLAVADPYMTEHAHEYAHGIGIEAFTRYPDIVSTFIACGDGSASGCRHGFVQAYLESRDSVTAPELQGLCQPFKNAQYSRALLFQCIHGMGHGLTMFHGHDARPALADCDRLADQWDQTSCYGGVFMEIFVNATEPHHPASELASHSHHEMAGMDMGKAAFKAIDPADPLYPCSIMEHRYLYSCYQLQTSVMLWLNHGDIGGAAKSCDKAPADMRASCYASLGRDVTAYASRDPQKSADLCAKGTPIYRASCFDGAARSLVNWTGTTDGAFALCRIVASDSRNRPADGTACFTALGSAISSLTTAAPQREEQCQRAQAPEAVAACRAGAGLIASR